MMQNLSFLETFHVDQLFYLVTVEGKKESSTDKLDIVKEGTLIQYNHYNMLCIYMYYRE